MVPLLRAQCYYPEHQRRGDRRALTELQAVPIVSFELCDEMLFSISVQGVVQSERPTQLTHTQVPLEPFGVVWEGEALLALLPEGNGFAQPINELRPQEEKPVTHFSALGETLENKWLRKRRLT